MVNTVFLDPDRKVEQIEDISNVQLSYMQRNLVVINRRKLLQSVRERMQATNVLIPKYDQGKETSWGGTYPQFMANAQRHKRTFVKHIENRIASLKTRGIINQNSREGRVYYNLSTDPTTGEANITKGEWYAIITSTLIPADKNVFIPEFLDKRYSHRRQILSI